MRIGKIIGTALLCMAGGLMYAGIDDGLIFYCDYEGKADAAFASGDKKSKSAFTPEFQAGVRGQALVIGGKPETQIKGVSYSPDKNFNAEKGTISFWLKPVDWDGSSKGPNIILQTAIGKAYFQIYKYWSDDSFIFLIGEEGKWVRLYDKMLQGWKAGDWHHVLVTWSSTDVQLFIDGSMVNSDKLPVPVDITQTIKPLSFGAGTDTTWKHSAIGSSLIDELRIYNRILNKNEIRELYLKDAENNVKLDSLIITIGEKPPEQDGKINDYEYSFASSGFTDMYGKVSKYQGQYFLSYDEKNLYIALSSDAKHSKGSAALKNAERCEIFIITENDPKDLRKFAVTANGEAYEGAADETWKRVNLKLKNTVENNKWLCEAAIPFSMLGVKEVPNGQTWRFNIGRVFASEKAEISIAPVIGKLSDTTHFADLKFKKDAPQIKISGDLDFEKNITAIDMSAKSGNPKSEIKYFGIGDNKKSYGLRSFQKILFANGKSTPYQSPQITAPDAWMFGEFSVGFSSITEKIDGRETELYRNKSILENPQPLKVFYLHTEDRKNFQVNAMKGAEGKIQVRFIKPDNSCAMEVIQDLPEDKYFKACFDLDFNKLQPGDYNVKIAYVAPDGKTSGIWEQEYRIPGKDAFIFKKYVDIEADKVPAPWIPIKVDADKVSMWGRTYDFSNGFLFSSLISQGTDILAAPAELRLNGEILKASTPPVLKKISSNDLLAVFEKTAEYGNFKVVSNIKVHFDGYCEFETTFSSPVKDYEIKSLSFDIPLKKDCATLYRDSKLSKIEKSKSGAIDGYLAENLFKGRGLYFWVGNENIGFNWAAKSLEAWSCFKHDKSMEFIPSGDTTTIRFNIIDTALKLDKPKTVQMGFTITPARPLDNKILRLRNGKDFEGWCQPWKYFAYPDYNTVNREEIERELKRSGNNPPEIFIYMGDSLTSPYSPEWSFCEQDWTYPANYGNAVGVYNTLKARNSGSYTGACIKSESFRNFLNNKRNEFFSLYKKQPINPLATSFYFDTGVVGGCSNEKHGCGKWKDESGKEYGYMAVDEQREITLNVYRMIKRTGPKAKVYTHHGWFRDMPVQVFTDIMIGGEGVEGATIKDESYYNILTPEMFRITFNPHTWGMKMVFINILLREMTPEKKRKFSLDNKKDRTAVLHAYGYCLTHDTDTGGLPVLDKMIWAAQDKIGWNENVKFFPYWENDAVKLVSPKSNRILASAYTNNGKMMLAILNDTDKEETVKLDLNLSKLRTNAGLKGTDIWTPGSSYTLSNSYEEKVGPRDFKLIVFDKAE